MGAVAIPMMGVGAGMNVIGSYYGAKGQKEDLRHSAVVNDFNARMAEKSAEETMLAHSKNAASFTQKVGQLKSKQRVAMAASGVEIGEGSSRDVLATTDVMKEIDLNQMRANAVGAAWGHRMEGVNFSGQARSARSSAESIDPFSAGMSSLLSSGGQVASSWYMMNGGGGGGSYTSPDKSFSSSWV